MSWCGGGEIRPTPGVEWRTLAIHRVDLVAGQLAAFAGLGALGHLDLDIMSELTRYSVVTPKRPDATCLIAERMESPLGSGSKRSGSSPPSPVFDLPPIRFIAIASVVVRFAADRAEGHGAGGEALDDLAGRFDLVERHGGGQVRANLMRNRPRNGQQRPSGRSPARRIPCTCPARCRARHAAASATVSGVQAWSSPRMRNMYSPPTSSDCSRTGLSPKASAWRSHGFLARDFVQADAFDHGCGAGEELVDEGALDRPTASKICAPQ